MSRCGLYGAGLLPCLTVLSYCALDCMLSTVPADVLSSLYCHICALDALLSTLCSRPYPQVIYVHSYFALTSCADSVCLCKTMTKGGTHYPCECQWHNDDVTPQYYNTAIQGTATVRSSDTVQHSGAWCQVRNRRNCTRLYGETAIGEVAN